MKKKRVLVFPAGSEIGLEIYRSLRYSKDFELVGASSVDDFGRFVYENYVPNIPTVYEKGFIEAINKVVQDRAIEYIFPAHDDVIVKLAQHQDELKATVVTSPYDTCLLCRSKKHTYDVLCEKIKTPIVYQADNITNFPVFMKPDRGQGSKGVLKANTINEVRLALDNDKSLLILEYLPGKEYTIDCFTDAEGRLIYAEARERTRIINGISVESRPVEIKQCRDMAKIINDNLKLRGVWFFQVKEDTNGELTLLEIAPRVAGTMALDRMKGVNLPLLSLYDRAGIKVSLLNNGFDLVISRALSSRYKINIKYSKVYVDFDDALIFDGKVNPELLAFLYRCINSGKSIHLITRHSKNIKNSLKKYMISEDIFTEIIMVSSSQHKSDFINPQHSIFIDDSFSERKKVHDALSIPVFDVSEAVEL